MLKSKPITVKPINDGTKLEAKHTPYKSFTSFLEDLCLEEEPQLIKDTFEDGFEEWLGWQDVGDIVELADKYIATLHD